MGTTREVNSPNYEKFNLLNIKRIRKNSNHFCFQGEVDKVDCVFKIDTGSDVSILSSKLLADGKKRIFVILDIRRGKKFP